MASRTPVYLAAAVQMTSTEQFEANWLNARRLARRAVGAGASFVALPENFAFLRTSPKGSLPISACRELPERLAALAVELSAWLLAGSIPERIRGDRRIYNASVLYAPDGAEVARYRKMHLFDIRIPGKVVFRESATVRAGTEPVLAETPLGRIGLSICYDLRFPELYRQLSGAGAQLLLVPAAFTAYTGRFHWLPLLRARAIENLCWVVAPAQVGVHGGGRESFGHSVVIDPWGTVVAERARGAGVVTAEIDLDRVREVRAGLPSLRHVHRELTGASRVRIERCR